MQSRVVQRTENRTPACAESFHFPRNECSGISFTKSFTDNTAFLCLDKIRTSETESVRVFCQDRLFVKISCYFSLPLQSTNLKPLVTPKSLWQIQSVAMNSWISCGRKSIVIIKKKLSSLASKDLQMINEV